MAKPKPAPLRERDITRQIAREYYKEFDQLIESDVIIVGAGPSGLLCAHDLAAMGFRTLLIEQSLALGGGFWSGGYLMNKATICEPANEILDELGVPCKQIKECEGMFMVDPPHATGALIAAAYNAGAKIMNLTRVLDLIIRQRDCSRRSVVAGSCRFIFLKPMNIVLSTHASRHIICSLPKMATIHCGPAAVAMSLAG